METVTVKSVEKTPSGWNEILLEDGRKVSTKDSKLAEAAFQSRDKEIQVEINTTTRGDFTNHYLNAIEGVEAGSPRRSNGAAPRGRSGGGKSPAEQERIARQWAYGRAVEALSMSSTDFTVPFDDATKAALTETAEWLLSQTK